MIKSSLFCQYPFSEAYAQYMLILTMSIVFSLTCPLITPFGLLYCILKYFVDKHNLMYVYEPTDIESVVHYEAAALVPLACLLQNMLMLVYSVVMEDMPSRTIYILFLTGISGSIFVRERRYVQDLQDAFEPTDHFDYSFKPRSMV